MDEKQKSKDDLRILVTDDSLLSRKVVCDILTKMVL